jgi:cytoskeleton protein RodZ
MSDVAMLQPELDGETEEPSASAGAGALLRAAREAQGLHIAMLAVSLKVSVKKLEALESNRFDLLPDLVFVRALASSVCRHLKIDEQPVLSALPRSEVPKIGVVGDGSRPRFQETGYATHSGLRRHLRSPWGVAFLLVLFGIVAIVFWPENVSRVEGMVTPASVLPPKGAALEAPVGSPEIQPVTSTPTSAASSTVAGATPAETAGAALTASGDVNIAPAPLAMGPLKLFASGSSWVEVTDADSAVVFRRTLAQGETAVINGKPPLSVVLGRADQVTVWVRDQGFDTSTYVKDSVARFQVK